MKNYKAFKKIEELHDYLKTKVRYLCRRLLRDKTEKSQERRVSRNLQSIAYQIMGERTGSLVSVFKGLDSSLQMSGLKTSFIAYVSLTVFTAILVTLVMLVFIPCLLMLAFSVPFWPAVLFGVGGSLFSTALSVIGFYIYPLYRGDKLRRELEDELPFAASYMAILTNAGVPTEKVFYSLSNLEVPLAASAEAKDVVRSVNLFGQDIISALEKASKYAPSKRFREMLEGLISTIHSGGDSSAYLREKSRQYMKLKKGSLKKFSDTLSVLSEFYVALLLTGPLLFVIMLAVMAMLGGNSLGILNPDLLLNLLTYVGLPLGAMIYLVILDAITPKW